MLFASYDFLLFFVPVLIGFWALRGRPLARTILLIGASYWFYMASAKPVGGALPAAWYFVGLLVFSTVLDYGVSGRIHALAKDLDHASPERARAAKRKRNLLLVVSLVGNLGLLGYFKYTNFFIEAFTDIANGLGAEWVAPHLDLVLPIGISFYTFQSLSYTIDVWRRRLTPEPSFAKFALFVVFFPQLVAGPIVRASEFLPQLHRRPTISVSDIEQGIFRILQGLTKKVILGDLIGAFLVDMVFAEPGQYTAVENLIALYAFTLQIYADFSGYSDIAIGVARLLGFKIPENFDRPYQARNLGEFWRRWHMTLSTWLRDYLFFPLGGSKKGKGRTFFNLWLTMFLVGMWHGASWNFVVYSNLHGGAMLFNRWNRIRDRGAPLGRRVLWIAVGALVLGLVVYALSSAVLALEVLDCTILAVGALVLWVLIAVVPDRPGIGVLHVILTFHFTVLSRIFFRSESLEHSRTMIRKLLDWSELSRGHWVRPGLWRHQSLQAAVDGAELGALATPLHFVTEYALLFILVLGTAYHFTPKRWIDDVLAPRIRRLPAPVLALLLAGLCVLIMHVLEGPRANIYFAF